MPEMKHIVSAWHGFHRYERSYSKHTPQMDFLAKSLPIMVSCIVAIQLGSVFSRSFPIEHPRSGPLGTRGVPQIKDAIRSFQINKEPQQRISGDTGFPCVAVGANVANSGRFWDEREGFRSAVLGRSGGLNAKL